MTGRWSDLGPDGRAVAEAAFEALETAARLNTPAAASVLSPSQLWAHATGAVTIPRAELAAALLVRPALREILAGAMERAALAMGPRLAAAATTEQVSERRGEGFRIRLIPSRSDLGQTYVVIALDRPDSAPARLAVLPEDGPPETADLDPPDSGSVQVLVPTASDLVRALADPASRVFLL